MKKILLSAIVPLSLACSSPSEKEKPKSEPVSAPKKEEPPAQRQLCLSGLSKLSTQTPPEERLSAVLSACSPGCRPAELKEPSDIDKWEKGNLSAGEIVEACDVFCSDEARASKTKSGATDWREVARVCGGEYYNLPIGQESLLTREWAALIKIAGYAGLSMRTSIDEPTLLTAAQSALKNYWILMPIPTFVMGQYKLPSATESQPIAARLFVRVDRGSNYLGALPVVMLTERGAATMDVPGLSWPSDVTLSALEEKVSSGVSAIKKSLGEPSSEPASDSAPSMMKTAETESPDDVVLYIADLNAPAFWFVDVVNAVPKRSVRLAVASDGKAVQHKVRFAKYNSNSNTAPTTITITTDSCIIGGASPLPPTSLPIQGGVCDPAALQAEISKAKISGDRLSLVLQPSIPMSQLVPVLDVASKLTSLAIFVQVEAAAPVSAPSSTSAPVKP